MSNTQRVNWMDWSKFLAVALVVPIHIPQALGAQPVTYFEVFLLACLMFNSGYLKREGRTWRENLKKYTHSIIIPYFIYNILYIPYWTVKFHAEQGTFPALADIARPLAGIFTLQTTTSFASELNLVTWFIASLLVMHLILDFCLQFRHGQWLMAFVCLLGIGLYTLSKYYAFTNSLFAVGTFKAIPFYYMGFLFRKYNVLGECHFRKDLLLFTVMLVVSILAFVYHANETDFARHMISYWPAVLSGLLAFTYFCRLLDGIHSQIIVNYSNGTMAFIGLHWMLVGTIRYGMLAPVFHVPSDYVYTPLEAYALALAVTLLLYPIILLLQKEAPWMLGK